MWWLVAIGAGVGILLFGIAGRKCHPPTSLGVVDMHNVPAHMALDPRTELPICIVVHTTEGSDRGTNADHVDRWMELATGDRNVLTHFEIRTDGTTICLVPPIAFQCWHAGSVNRYAVGIDLATRIGDGNPRGQDGANMPRAMLEALVRLVNSCELCNLAIVGHGTHLDPAHRHDPGKNFPWHVLGCDRVVRCYQDCWDRKCVVTREEIEAKHMALRGRTSTYSYKDVCLDASAVFVGEHNAHLV